PGGGHRRAGGAAGRPTAGADPQGVRPAGPAGGPPRARLQPRIPPGARLGLRVRRRRPYSGHPRAAAAQEVGRAGRADRAGLERRLPLRPGRRRVVSVSRLRWQLTLSHLRVIVLTLLCLVAAAVVGLALLARAQARRPAAAEAATVVQALGPLLSRPDAS